MTRIAVLALVLLAGCDVEASLGSHDAGRDAHAPSMCHAPADAGTCAACQAESCCDAFAACAAAATCPCIVDCVLRSHTVAECETHCGGPDHGEHAALLDCTSSHCLCP